MRTLTHLVAVLGLAVLLQACTAASGIFDNNCSGNGFIHPGAEYCSSYTAGVSP